MEFLEVFCESFYEVLGLVEIKVIVFDFVAQFHVLVFLSQEKDLL